MLTQYLQTMIEHWILLAVFFVLLFAGICYLFARDRFADLLAGLLRLVGSILYSPFVYLKKAIHGIADYGSHGEKEFSGTKQYLLSKLLMSLQGILVVYAIAVLSLSFVTAWNDFMPRKDSRDALHRAKAELKQAQADFDQTANSIQQMDAQWPTQRDSVAKAGDASRKARMEQAAADNRAIESDMNTRSGPTNATFQTIRDYLQKYEGIAQAGDIQQVDDESKSYLRNQSLNQADADDLNRYVTNWATIKLERRESKNLSDDRIRASVQPQFSEFKSKLERLKGNISRLEERKNELAGYVKYNFIGAAKDVLLGLIGFIATVWVMGLLIELLWLGVNVATNVQALRDHFYEEDSHQTGIVKGD